MPKSVDIADVKLAEQIRKSVEIRNNDKKCLKTIISKGLIQTLGDSLVGGILKG